MHEIIVDNQTSFRFYNSKSCQDALNFLTQYLKIKVQCKVNLVIISKEQMIFYNKNYRQKNAVTDVLSFPSDYKDLFKFLNYYELGDILICSEKVVEQAKNYGHTIRREFTYLFTHALLHIFGFDHQTEVTEKHMNKIAKMTMEKIRMFR